MFKPPKSSYPDQFNESKFNVTWSIFIFLIIVFGGLSVYHYLGNDPSVKSSLLALCFSLISILLLFKTRKYETSAIINTIAGSLICQYAMFGIDDSERISDLMWIVLVCFYAFYTLGSAWGGFLLVINLIGLMIKTTLYSGDPGPINDHHINTIINVSISTLAVSYIFHKLIKSTELSNKKLTDVNKQLEYQNEEKTVLLKEIHHRVKNNLQVVSSLLRLQASEIDEENTQIQFQEAISRINSMALIHEKMYQKEELAKLDFRTYLDTLITELVNSYSTKTKITTSVISDVHQIEIKNIVPIALIFNELITNSLKHAFSGMEKGNIDIEIKMEDKDVVISYRDNGNWVKSDKEFSFGMILIDTFTEQLDGKYQLNTDNGTEYKFCFCTPRK